MTLNNHQYGWIHLSGVTNPPITALSACNLLLRIERTQQTTQGSFIICPETKQYCDAGITGPRVYVYQYMFLYMFYVFVTIWLKKTLFRKPSASHKPVIPELLQISCKLGKHDL